MGRGLRPLLHLRGRTGGPTAGPTAGRRRIAGIAGSPLAGHLAGRFPVRRLLITTHLLRLGTLCALLVVTRYELLLAVVALTHLGDRAAKTLEMLFATRVAGERRATYQASPAARPTRATRSARAPPRSDSPSAPARPTRP
ncbi:hypothetical protein ACFSNO_18990 [Streptomyces cirratus]